MPAAARVTDKHRCPSAKPESHVGGPIVPRGEPTVLIGFKPAARVGDGVRCTAGITTIAEGEPTVVIGQREAARIGDPTEHGGAIVSGCKTVLIGSSVVADALRSAAETGAPLCEEPRGHAVKKDARRAKKG